MARYLKRGMSTELAQQRDDKVRSTVEDILKQIETRGDAAVREYSEQFDKWAPQNFRLSRKQIDACFEQLEPQVIDDIRFAQAQVRNFAQIQRDSMQDVERETLPGRLHAAHLPLRARWRSFRPSRTVRSR